MPSIRSVVAPLRRYRELRQSQYWSDARLRAHASAKLDATLAAAAAIPFYRSRFGDRQPPRAADLHTLPVLKRTEIEALNRSVRSTRDPAAAFIRGCTSGSTGLPVEFLFDPSHERGRLAAVARHLRDNGWTPARRSAWICAYGLGAPGAGSWRRLCPSASVLPVDASAADQLASFARRPVTFLHTLPSNLRLLVEAVRASPTARPPAFRRIFAGAEVLDDSLREEARRLFGADITDAYGATEAFLAWQCPRGAYHVNAEHVWLEIVDECDRPVAPGRMGRVLVTTLENQLMPLVRYAIGDYAYAADGPCGCGRTLPVIGKVAGRSVDLFRRPDGTLFSPWAILAGWDRGGSNRLADEIGLRQIQLVQMDIARYVLRHSSERNPGRLVQSVLERQLKELIGVDVSVAIERVAEIPRTASGKFMVARSELASNG